MTSSLGDAAAAAIEHVVARGEYVHTVYQQVQNAEKHQKAAERRPLVAPYVEHLFQLAKSEPRNRTSPIHRSPLGILLPYSLDTALNGDNY
jgi:hypothetical protein